MKKYDAIKVIWKDSTYKDAWLDPDEMKGFVVSLEDTEMITIAMYYDETKDFLILVHTRTNEDIINYPFAIPQSEIISVKRL